MRKKRQSQRVNGAVPFDAIGALVVTKPFRCNTRIAGILHGLRVDDQEANPFWFFSRMAKLAEEISAPLKLPSVKLHNKGIALAIARLNSFTKRRSRGR